MCAKSHVLSIMPRFYCHLKLQFLDYPGLGMTPKSLPFTTLCFAQILVRSDIAFKVQGEKWDWKS